MLTKADLLLAKRATLQEVCVFLFMANLQWDGLDRLHLSLPLPL